MSEQGGREVGRALQFAALPERGDLGIDVIHFRDDQDSQHVRSHVECAGEEPNIFVCCALFSGMH